MMENARRWAGYVCPDCRFVFRVQRDHDGQGVVCPSCRRLLRIPTSADVPPPLLAPSQQVETHSLEEAAGKTKSRRRKKAGGAESHSWEHLPHLSKAKNGDGRQMRWMLVGGASLFALIVAGVIISMKGGNAPAPTTRGTVQAPPAAPTEPVQAPIPAATSRGIASLLAEAEPLGRKFLEAKTVDELLPLVRNPSVAEARLRELYPQGKIEPRGLAKFNSGGEPTILGKFISCRILTREGDEKPLAFIDTPLGLKVDWESWAGWSEIPWKKFLSSKPATSHVFRVILSSSDYYNFGFSDDSKWHSYRLESPDREHVIFGYVEKGSVLDHRLRPDEGVKGVSLMLSLKFPPQASSNNQVEIERLVNEGWIENPDLP